MIRLTAFLIVTVGMLSVASADIISWHASSGVLPDDPSIPAESRFQVDFTRSFLSMQEGHMKVNDNIGDSKVVVRKYVPGAISPGEPYAYQAEIRMNSHNRPTHDFGVALGLFDGAREAVILVASDAIGFAGDTEALSFLHDAAYNLDTTDGFHTFRVIHELGDVHLFVDTFDAPVLSVLYADLPSFGDTRVDMLQTSRFGGLANFDVRAFAYNLNGTAIPEPSTLALFAMGAVWLLVYGWRKRKRGMTWQ